MKGSISIQLFVALLLSPVSALSWNRRAAETLSGGERPITRVISLLERMLSESRELSKTGQETHAKAVCHCDDTRAEAQAMIEESTENIAKAESAIAVDKGAMNDLSKQVDQLVKEIASATSSLTDATSLNRDEAAAFESKKKDLESALAQLNQALDLLTAVGGDQALGAAADHSEITAALQLGAALSKQLPSQLQRSVKALLQQPNSGSYSAQSGEIVGILKQMKDSLSADLETSGAEMAAKNTAFSKLTNTLEASISTMNAQVKNLHDAIETTGNSLSSETEKLKVAREVKATNLKVLEETTDSCAASQKSWEVREKQLLVEQSALSKVIKLLSSDTAFAKFGKVTATRAEFLQVRTVETVLKGPQKASLLQHLLLVPGSQKFQSLRKVVAMVQSENPFSLVVAEIEKIISQLSDEQKVDKAQLQWCSDARASNSQHTVDTTASIDTLKSDLVSTQDSVGTTQTAIETLQGQISEITNLIAKTTDARVKEHQEYDANVKECQDVTELLNEAIKILKENEEAAGESSLSAAISELTVLLQNTRQEESTLGANEEKAVQEHDKFISERNAEVATAKSSVAEEQVRLAGHKNRLSELQLELKSKGETLANLVSELADLNPGCTFIEKNIELRESNRVAEQQALEQAKQLMQESPVYQRQVELAHNQTLGECVQTCFGKEDDATCKACMTRTTVIGYCTSHPGTKGC